MSLFPLFGDGTAEDYEQTFGTRAPSLETYREIEPDLPRRRRVVLTALRALVASTGGPVTGYELTQAMQAQGTARDVNDVRPRLTELHQSGAIVSAGKRPCRVTNKAANVWAPVEK